MEVYYVPLKLNMEVIDLSVQAVELFHHSVYLCKFVDHGF